MESININKLKQNSINRGIYGVEEISEDFINNIKEKGVLVPLVIKKDGTIISGHRRFKAAKQLHLKELPVNFIKFKDDLEEKETLISFNKQREKTYSQKYNEVKLIEEIEIEKANLRKVNGAKQSKNIRSVNETKVTLNPKVAKSANQAKNIIAKKTGFGSEDTLRKYEKIKEAGNHELLEKLDKREITINKAYQHIKAEERKKENEQKIKAAASKKNNSNIKILEGDLFDLIGKIEDNSIDLLCTDPPYFVLTEEWDDFKNKKDFLDFTESWINTVIPKINPSTGRIYISFPCDYKYNLYNILKKYNFYDFIFGNEIIWVKRNNNQMSNKKNYRFQYESILYLYGKDCDNLNFLDYGEIQTNVWEIAIPQSNFKEGKFHPAQKPLELYKRIIETGSKENDLVLDCFAGSGTTGIVCKQLNRKCILIEKDKNYIEIIRGRINSELD